MLPFQVFILLGLLQVGVVHGECSEKKWKENNGVVMIEPEEIDFQKYDRKWTLEEKGGETYIEYDKNNNWGGVYQINQVGKLCYPIEITSAGWWKFEFKNVNSHPTEHNDAYVNIKGQNWYGVQKGKNPNYSQNRRFIGDKYQKVYRNRNTGFWEWDSYTIDHNGHDIFFNVNSPPLKTSLCLAGRSTKFGVGKLLLWKFGQVTSNRARSTPQTCAVDKTQRDNVPVIPPVVVTAPVVSKIRRRCVSTNKNDAPQKLAEVNLNGKKVVESWHDEIKLPTNMGSYYMCKFFFRMDLPKGSHKYELESNDGADLKTGTKTLVNNDGLHKCKEVSNNATPIGSDYVITYFQFGGGNCLSLWVDDWKIKATGKAPSNPRPPPTPSPPSSSKAKIVRKCVRGKYSSAFKVNVGNAKGVSLSTITLPTGMGDLYGCKFYITMPLGKGNHDFVVEANDGAVLQQGNQVIVNNDGLHACTSRSKSTSVNGDTFVLTYFQHKGGSCLRVYIDGKQLTTDGTPSITPIPLPEPPATKPPSQKPAPTPAPAPFPNTGSPGSLRQLADKRGIYFGAAVNYFRITSAGNKNANDRNQYQQIVKRDYNVLVAENACKFYTIRRQSRNSWDWSRCDTLIDIAKSNGQQFRGHTLSWNKWQPDWIMSKSLSGSAKREILKEHLSRVITHYKNRGPGVYAWDVANEVLGDGQNDMNSYRLKTFGPWYPAIPDYVEVAYRAAAAARGNSKYPLLFYNDYAVASAEGGTAGKSNIWAGVCLYGSPKGFILDQSLLWVRTGNLSLSKKDRIYGYRFTFLFELGKERELPVKTLASIWL